MVLYCHNSLPHQKAVIFFALSVNGSWWKPDLKSKEDRKGLPAARRNSSSGVSMLYLSVFCLALINL